MKSLVEKNALDNFLSIILLYSLKNNIFAPLFEARMFNFLMILIRTGARSNFE